MPTPGEFKSEACMKTVFQIFLTCVFCSFIARAEEPSGLTGEWTTTKKDAVIQIYKTNNAYFGKIVWLKDRPEGKAEELKDVFNPNPELRNQPLIGLII